MRAVSCEHATLAVVDLPDPRPAHSQLLLNVLRCGICGSDLHAKDHTDELAESMAAVGVTDTVASDKPVVFGHEFCGEVAERGRGASKRFREPRWCRSRCCGRAAGCT
jgi:threonine dehydrogenase-like Zn-dependent dehydrogenase